MEFDLKMVSATGAARGAVRLMDPEGLCGKLGCREQMVFEFLLLGLAWVGYGRLRVVEGLRSLEREKKLWGQGRTEGECRKAGVPVEYASPDSEKRVWCLPEKSKHVRGMAIDLDLSMYAGCVPLAMGRIAKMLHVTWGGNWRVRDYGHFEV